MSQMQNHAATRIVRCNVYTLRSTALHIIDLETSLNVENLCTD